MSKYFGRKKMNKNLLFSVLLFMSCTLSAQEVVKMGKEDVWNAFKQYNPSALQKASLNQQYGDLLYKLSLAYSAPKTEENEVELIALVKNFDNSIILQSIKEEYESARTLQLVSGADLNALEEKTQKRLLNLVKSIYKNTLEVKEIQIDRYKQDLKAVKKNKNISSEQKNTFSQEIEKKVNQVKKEINVLKKNRKQKIQDSARVYFVDIKTAYEAKQEKTLQAKPQVKANPQKTAAQ